MGRLDANPGWAHIYGRTGGPRPEGVHTWSGRGILIFSSLCVAGSSNMVGTDSPYPEGFSGFLAFLCKKYDVDPRRVFISYDSNPPPLLRGTRPGYCDGLLSYRERNGNSEFLITVFKIARNPLLTLGHEFAHLVDDLKQGSESKHLGPLDDAREKKFDLRAMRDLAEFQETGT